MTPPRSSPFIAFLTVAAVTAAAGIAYCSSASNTTAFGTLLIEILRYKRIQEKNEKNGERIDVNKTSDNKNYDDNDESKQDDFERAFVSWLDQEETENDFFRLGNNHGMSKHNTLTDPRWMSETIRDALHLTALSNAEAKRSIARSVLEEPSHPPSTSSSVRTKSKQQPQSTSGAQEESNDEETRREMSFSRSFRSLQNATKIMMNKEPAIREDFFNGVIVEGENDHWEEETKQQRRRSLSLSSSASSWSGTTSSMSSYQINEEDSLVEEEEEVERLLIYLSFVEFAIEGSSSISSKDHYDSKSCYLPKGRQGIAPETDDYELVRFSSIMIEGTTEMQRAKVSHVAAIHRDRKELVIAVHYDESSLSSFTADHPKRMKSILMSSLIQQQQDQSLVDKTSASNSFVLLHEAAKSLSQEIICQYQRQKTAKKTASSSPFLSLGYSLVLCGHSMGAALACQLGDLLTKRNRELSDSYDVRVYAFGPPPCLPLRRKFCLDGDDPEGEYFNITSVVNNHDCVPRWTESNLLGLQMSLNSLMNRKKRHFHRYRNQTNKCGESANPATYGKSAVVRRSSPRVPPFSVASRDWRMFWKDDHESNTFLSECSIDENTSTYIVPGRVVSIWNHSQDPMIIGAKVHSPERKGCHPSSNDLYQFSRHHRGNRKNYDVLGRLWIDEGMFSDHTIEAYRSNLELLLGQVTNTI